MPSKVRPLCHSSRAAHVVRPPHPRHASRHNPTIPATPSPWGSQRSDIPQPPRFHRKQQPGRRRLDALAAPPRCRRHVPVHGAVATLLRHRRPPIADQLGHVTMMPPPNRAHAEEKSDKPPPQERCCHQRGGSRSPLRGLAEAQDAAVLPPEPAATRSRPYVTTIE